VAVQVEMQLTHSLKAPGFNPETYEVRNWFQNLLLNATYTATTRLCLRLRKRRSLRRKRGGAPWRKPRPRLESHRHPPRRTRTRTRTR
jgi:hypothetical protein